jgi:RNA polymerase II elongation factor ELL
MRRRERLSTWDLKYETDLCRINYVKDGSLGTPGRRGGPSGKVTSKSKLMSQNRSMPASPALSGTGSPSLGPTSVPFSQQQAEKAKAIRKPVIHLLAVGPMMESALIEQISDETTNDIKQALQKVGDLNQDTNKWELGKKYYKELDVWSYDYDTQEDRQRAIDNAIKTYDRMRLEISEPEWERLLPKKDRGQGKVLSKLQKDIAEGLGRGPKINVQKTEDSGRDTPIKDDVKGENTPRASSQPPTAKAKKPTEKEAQAKRLLSGKSAKPAAPKAPVAKKEKEKPVSKPTGKVLSSQFVNSSDDDEDFLVAPTVIKSQPLKRSRVDDETSDSSIPLSKKIKKEVKEVKEVKPTTNRDSSQSSRVTTSHYQPHSHSQSQSSQRNKGTSPHKSSPLASSPPTNASDFESSSSNSSGRVSPVRKVSNSPIHKRHQKSSSVASSVSSTSSQRSLKPAVVDLARKYRSYYPKYASLHTEVANLGRRDREMEQKLLDMHERLSTMKAEILEGIIEIS